MTHDARTTAHEIRNKKRGRLCCVNSDTTTIQCVGRNNGFFLPLSTSPSPRLLVLLVRTSSIALPIALRANLHSYTGPPPAPQLSSIPRTLHPTPIPTPVPAQVCIVGTACACWLTHTHYNVPSTSIPPYLPYSSPPTGRLECELRG